MEDKPLTNLFREVHRKVEVAKGKAQKAREDAAGVRQRDAEEEATREGFDRPATKAPSVEDDETTQ